MSFFCILAWACIIVPVVTVLVILFGILWPDPIPEDGDFDTFQPAEYWRKEK